MIEVKNLTRRFGSHLAVDDLSFTVEDGQIYGFLGPNGAGKSTTMNIMTGYLGATSGQVIINGHDILEEPEEAKACIGFLPEQPPLYMEMTVLEYLKFVAELKKIPKEDRWDAIEVAMEKVKILDMADRLIKNLSKGYRQRVGLAQAILGMPPIIILDEPTVGLDPKQIIEIRDLIKSLAKDHTVILSSHILSEISAVCDHIMIISHGKLVASDTTENLMVRKEATGALELLVRGEAMAVRHVVEGVGLHLLACQDGEEMGTVKLRVELGQNQDVREELFSGMAQANIPILEMKKETASLEKLFLELTEGDIEQGETDLSESEEKEEKPPKKWKLGRKKKEEK